MVAAYRVKPTQYARWTDRGLELWPEPKRLLFLIPRRVIPESQRSMMARLFPEVAERAEDKATEQHWECPSLLPDGGIPIQQK